MATQSVEFSAPSGQTVTARLFSAGSDTVVQTASAVTEATNRDGVYTATFTDAAAGSYRLIATNSGGTLLAQWWVDLTLTTATFQAYEMPISAIQAGLSTFDAASDSVTVGSMNANTVTASALATDAVTEIQSGLSTLDAAGVRAAVGMASANLDTQLADLPTVAEFQARTLAAAAYFDPATDQVTLTTASVDAIGDAFLSHTITKGDAGSIERAFWQVSKAAASFDGSVQTSGSNTGTSFLTNISVDDYAGQVLVFVSGNLSGQSRAISSVVSGVVTVQSQFTEAPASGDEFLIIPSHVHPISEIQSGLATAANQTTILNRLGSWTGSGLNTILGAFRALAGKAASLTPTDISSGTTFDNTTDSLEAIRDRGDAAWAPGEAGSGDASQSTLLAVQDQVEAIAGTLGGTSINVTNRVADGGSMVLYTGDDMRVRSGTSVTVTISDAAGGIYSRLSAIGASNLAWGAARQSQAAGAISGTISSLTQSGAGSAQVVNLVIEINDAGQSLNPADDYIWQVVSTSSSGDEYTEIEGTLDLRRRVAVPV
jgi:hypothetical protein